MTRLVKFFAGERVHRRLCRRCWLLKPPVAGVPCEFCFPHLVARWSDAPAQPERDPHRDGCVHDPAWACEDCLAARSAAPQPADNAQAGERDA